MTSPNAAYLSAISLLLAAYGFFYNLYRDRIEDGLHAGDPKQTINNVKDQIKAVEGARKVALALGLVPLLVWLVFLPPVIEEIIAAADVIRDAGSIGDALGEYSAIDMAFCLVASAWAVIAWIVLSYVVSLQRDLGKLRAQLAKLERKNQKTATSPAAATD